MSKWISKSHEKCTICGQSRQNTPNLFLASLPLDPERCRQWVQAIGEPDLVHLPIEKLHVLKFVCSSHFTPNDFNKRRNRLLKTAVPKLKLSKPRLPDHLFVDFPLRIGCQMKQNFPRAASIIPVIEKPTEHLPTTNNEAFESPTHDSNSIFELSTETLEESKNETCKTQSYDNSKHQDLAKTNETWKTQSYDKSKHHDLVKTNKTWKTQSYDKSIHQDLAKTMSNILCQGLPEPVKTKMLNKYGTPNNCLFLAAPSFNQAIQNILPKSTKVRDEAMKNSQQQLGMGIAAVSKALSSFLSDGNKEESVNEAKQILADACQILTDVHFMMTQQRLSMLADDHIDKIAADPIIIETHLVKADLAK